MTGIYKALTIVASIMIMSACMTMTIEGDVPKTPSSKSGTDTMHGSIYGFSWSKPQVEKCDNQRGLARARYHTNAVYLLASVISAGLYVPQTVEWWCDGSSTDTDGKIYNPNQ